MDAISALQAVIISACAQHAGLITLIGENSVSDAPLKGKSLPYVAIVNHRLTKRPADGFGGQEHAVSLSAWVKGADRAKAAQIAHSLIDALSVSDLSHPDLTIISSDHLRTDVNYETRSGRTRARVDLRFFTQLNT